MMSFFWFLAGVVSGAAVAAEYPGVLERVFEFTGWTTLVMLLGYGAILFAALLWMLARDTFRDWRERKRNERTRTAGDAGEAGEPVPPDTPAAP